jgi:antitoxin PrlF
VSNAQSKVTAQGQISIPADVRRRLGVGPGSVLEWEEKDGVVIVRKAGRFTSADIHRVLFGAQAKPEPPVDLKGAIRKHIRQKHARC